MPRIALLLILLVGCVPKAKYDESLAYSSTLQHELEAALGAVEDGNALAQGLEDQLANEEAKVHALDELARSLEAGHVVLRERLEELSGLVADLSTRNKSERQAKADLEALVASLHETSSAAEERVGAAQQRIAALQAERERLEADQERLRAEAERLRLEREALAERTQAYDDLVRELKGEIDQGQVTITELSGKLTVSLSNAILFDSGKYVLRSAGADALTKVAGVLATISDREIRVEGHTDDDPVRGGAVYADNWALSALRASTVVSLLVGGGVDPLNIAAVGYGEHHPLASNADAEGKAQNRRTEIVLVPRLAALDAVDADVTIEDAPE